MISGFPREHVGYPEPRSRAPINEMCESLKSRENVAEFVRDEQSYCLRYGLTKQQRQAVQKRDFLLMLESGGNMQCLSVLAALSELRRL